MTNLPTFHSLFTYAFMQHALIAGTAVALAAGAIGYFIVMRRMAFSAHALSHIGFTGAAGAVLAGVQPLIGLFSFTFGGALGMGYFGRRAENHDVAVGSVLAFMLGLGVLFISLYSGYATTAYAILFGEILGISTTAVYVTVGTSVALLCALAYLYRPLLFASVDPEVAEARGINVHALTYGFYILVALATSIAVQVVGVLLIFALLVTPAAIAVQVTRRPLPGLLLSALIALVVTWAGIVLAYFFPYPVSFFITGIAFVLYLATNLGRKQ